jgi:F0F1-type ATP synthase membrane subunit b/b'
MTSVIVGLVALLVGVAAGFLIRASMARSGARTIEARATTTLTNARQESDQIRREAEQVRVQAEQEAAQTLRRSLEEAKNDAAARPKRT